MSYDDCPKCGVTDYGFELPDTRETLYHYPCRDAEGKCDCEEKDQECEAVVIKVCINRIWDQECTYCNGVDWRPEWQVLADDKVIATVPSENAAYAVVEAEYPKAEADYDPAWESERWLRQAEGWG